MLIEQRLRAFAALLLQRALRLAATKPRTIGVGLLRRRFLCCALPQSIQIDDISHARLHYAKIAGRERQRRGKTDSIAIQNPRMPMSDRINNRVSLCGNQTYCALARAHAMAIAE